MPTLELFLLGQPQIYLANQEITTFNTRKDRALLIYLAVTGMVHSREALAGLFWSDLPEPKARRNLRLTLSNLRKVIGAQWFETDDGIGLTRQLPWSVDMQKFRTVVESLASSRDIGPPFATSQELDACHQVLNLYRGEFLEGFYIQKANRFEEWVSTQREEYHLLALQGLERLAHNYLVDKEYAQGLKITHRLLHLEPWSEIAHSLQMQLYAESGQRGAALAQYEECCNILAHELGIDPMPQTTALYEQIRQGNYDQDPASQRLQAPILLQNSAERPQYREVEQHTEQGSFISNNLSAPLVPLIGYADELIYIQTQLASDDCRLLTIVGMGGMGKTHLVLAVGQRVVNTPTMATHFRDGVYFVALDTVRDELTADVAATAIANAIADAMGYPLHNQESPQKQLQTYLHPKKMLLILDNLEHLLDGTSLIVTLLQQAGGLTILGTSREKLDLQGEHVLELSGLAGMHSASDTHWQENDAVALFVYRAQMIDRHFRLDEENLPYIVRICQLLNGLPLGIELAAKWLDMLNCEAIADEIAEGLDFLQASRRDSLSRHQTLRAVFERSWSLLSPFQQQILARLSIFQSNFRADAALAVTGASLRDLATLVNKSLLGHTSNRYFTMHRSIRQYADEKLQQNEDDYQSVEARYISFYLDLLAQHDDDLHSLTWQDAKTVIINDIGNVKSVLWLAIQRKKWRELYPAFTLFTHLYDQQGWFVEGADFCQEAIEHLAESLPMAPLAEQRNLTIFLGRFWAIRGWLETRLGEFELASASFQRSLAIFHQITEEIEADNHADIALLTDVKGFWGSCLTLFGLSEHWRGRPIVALELLQEAVSLCTKPIDLTLAYDGLAKVLYHLGRYREAQAHSQQGLRIASQLGDQRFQTFLMMSLGRIEQASGDYATAKKLFQECLNIRLDLGDQVGIVFTEADLGEIARLEGNYPTAHAYLQRSLALATEIDFGMTRAELLWALGNLAFDQGDYVAAKAHFLESEGTVGFHPLKVGLPTLGWAHIGLDELIEAEAYFQNIIQMTWPVKAYRVLMEGVGGLIILLRTAGSFDRYSIDRSLIEEHPATTQETKDRIRKMDRWLTIRQQASPQRYQPTPGLPDFVERVLLDIHQELLADTTIQGAEKFEYPRHQDLVHSNLPIKKTPIDLWRRR